MSTQLSKMPQSSDSQYYDAQYYKDHFGYVSEGKDYLALAEYWKYSIFTKNSLNPDARILDYGCGLGQVSAALPNTMCYDPSAYARTYLKARKRVVVDSPEQIPACQFDFLISSHSLEHSSTPAEDLRRFRRFMKPSGRLILILPIEEDWKPRLEPDSNQHFQCWTFQTITNLLNYCGWNPVFQDEIFNPFLLRTLTTRVSMQSAVKIACAFGKIRRQIPAMLTTAELKTSSK